jgi:multidrug efflux pump subunit AcrB
VLAPMLWDTEFSMMGLIGVVLLIGLVNKNAIIMFAFVRTSNLLVTAISFTDLPVLRNPKS